VLVVDRAISSDQGIKFVYVVDKENKVQYRRVTSGAFQDDGLRVITEGLRPDELVVVGGLQQVRPRMQVQPERGPMPSLSRDTAADATTVEPVRPESPHPAGKTKPTTDPESVQPKSPPVVGNSKATTKAEPIPPKSPHADHPQR
jgi:multidrug efflux system membrane fusion protein